MVVIVVVIVAGVAIVIYSFVRRQSAGNLPSIGINNVTISVSPASLPCGSSSTFSVTVAATGWSDTITPRNYSIRLFDHDSVTGDDLLEEYVTAAAASAGIVPTGSRPPYSWSTSDTLTLSCSDCTVVGARGSSGESDPDVYAIFKVLFGSQPEQTTSQVTVTCTSP